MCVCDHADDYYNNILLYVATYIYIIYYIFNYHYIIYPFTDGHS